MIKKLLLGLLVVFLILLGVQANAVPPIPARIGGTVTVNGTGLTQATDTGFTFTVTKANGTAYVPTAEDTNGLNTSNWYMIDIPIYDAADQTGGGESRRYGWSYTYSRMARN